MKYRIFISTVDISANLKNIDIDIDIDKEIFENIDIDIDIDKESLENIAIDIDKAILKNIDIDIDKENLENIDIDIDKEILENIDIDKEILKNIDIDIDKEISGNIDIDKISNRLEFGISNRATTTPFPSSHPPPPPQVNLDHALFFAALLGRLQIVQTLLDKGAKVVIIKFFFKTKHGKRTPQVGSPKFPTPIMLCARTNFVHVANSGLS